ncbi:major latex protein 146-like [Papaver somniferum]|uniref:major latex protein 146-like n=1 Tax=Papaver somniferum TaxID=3469 RepID=UPI000E704B9A|nr:major latex protein 146-like [Papaver somniferum]
MAHAHGISGLVGKLITESEVNCNADKFYQMFKHDENITNIIPHIYTSFKVVEGDGLISGCTKEWGYLSEGKARIVKEQTTFDDETRTIHHCAKAGDMMNDYKKFVLTLVVNPKAHGQGSTVKWIIDYEKINEDSPVPFAYLSLCIKITEGLNSHIYASE